MKQISLAILFFFSLSPEVLASSQIDVEVTLAKNRLWTAKSEFIVYAPPKRVWAIVVEDIDHWKEYIPRILFSRLVSQATAAKIVKAQSSEWDKIYPLVLEEELPIQSRIHWANPHEWVFFKVLLMDLPWPVENRWVLQREQDRFDPATASYSRRFELVAGNLVVAEGYWRARPHPDRSDWSIVYYENSYDPGFQVPGFAFKPLVRKDTRKILEAVRKRAEGLPSRH